MDEEEKHGPIKKSNYEKGVIGLTELKNKLRESEHEEDGSGKIEEMWLDIWK